MWVYIKWRIRSHLAMWMRNNTRRGGVKLMYYKVGLLLLNIFWAHQSLLYDGGMVAYFLADIWLPSSWFLYKSLFVSASYQSQRKGESDGTILMGVRSIFHSSRQITTDSHRAKYFFIWLQRQHWHQCFNLVACILGWLFWQHQIIVGQVLGERMVVLYLFAAAP